MNIVEPSLDLESAFLNFYQDFAEKDIENAEYYSDGVVDFPNYVQRLVDESNGVNLPDGYVPCNHLWLVNDQKMIMGVIRIRHNIDNAFLALEAGHIGYDIAPSFRGLGYGKNMLKLALPIAKQLGISKALITANEDNQASRRVIEANGGQFEKIVMGKVYPNSIARYWVNCS